jgi:hypothetical protein
MLAHHKTWEEAQEEASTIRNSPPTNSDAIVVLPLEKRSYEPPERSFIEKILDDIDFHTPKKGYNLCYADSFDDCGEQLCTIGHYETYDEALQARGGNEAYFIYPARRRVEPE